MSRLQQILNIYHVFFRTKFKRFDKTDVQLFMYFIYKVKQVQNFDITVLIKKEV